MVNVLEDMMQNQHVVGRCIQFTFAVSVVLDKLDEAEMKANIENTISSSLRPPASYCAPALPAGDVSLMSPRGASAATPHPAPAQVHA